MTVEERMAKLEARIMQLEAELAEEQAKVAANATSIAANKEEIESNKQKIASQKKNFMDMMANSMAETYADQMKAFVDPSIIPEREETPAAPAEAGPSADQQMASAYLAEPELTAEEQIEMASYVVSPAELKEEMKEAGIEVPEAAQKAEGEKKEAGPSADQQMASDYLAAPELSAIDELVMESYAGSPAGLKSAIKAVEEENK